MGAKESMWMMGHADTKDAETNNDMILGFVSKWAATNKVPNKISIIANLIASYHIIIIYIYTPCIHGENDDKQWAVIQSEVPNPNSDKPLRLLQNNGMASNFY